MSYESQNILPKRTSLKLVKEFLEMLDYRYLGNWDAEELGKIQSYQWFERNDYKSWSGVELSLFKKDKIILIETRTNAGRSYYDLEHQNKTIKLLRQYFKGQFFTDYGKSTYLHPNGIASEPSESGCYLAFSAFGSNLIRVRQYFDSRNFNERHDEPSGIYWIDRFNPKYFSNTLILPFIASIAEDFWKSTYIALLKYSTNKEKILKGNRISSERLAQVSEGQLSIEDAFAESIPFGRLSMVCKHFKALDSRIDFAGVLKRPYRRRKKSLFDSLEEMTEIRNEIIHSASSPIFLDDDYIQDLLNIIHDSVERCYTELTKINDWKFNKGWGVGRLK
ncbi:hypothetical protein [uncultured Mesonia sp.]|uniref:hypothetical protein n=1 Tax=uncultured Mesonia sp. TaxID=399731 RepID=UPI00374E9A14